MLLDEYGNVTITNDGATILKQLEIEHPAGKVLVELANTQDAAVGDGTTSVVIFAAELLKRSFKLIKENIHPTLIISGYKLAAEKSVEFLKDKLRIKTKELDDKSLINVGNTTMSSKILGSDSDFFSKLCVEALKAVKTKTADGKVKYPIGNVHILKCHGQSAHDSFVVPGYAINWGRASQQMPQFVKNAKIALLDIDLRRDKLKLGVQVLISDPTQLEGVREREITMIRDRINMILKAGANVVLTSRGIDDLCMKYFVEADAIAVRRVDKTDLKKLAGLTGATILTTFADLNGEESFSPSYLGEAAEVYEDRLADDELMYFKGCKNLNGGASTIVLRGANEFMLDEMDRTVHDALCTIRKVMESRYVVPGGGCVEAALCVYLERFANTIETREQLAIAEYAEALLAIPKILAVNAACDATELVAKLRAFHNEAQQNEDDPKKHDYFYYGLDLMEGKTRNNLEAGVLEPAITKMKILDYATEAATTILRIDDKIKKRPEEKKEKPRRGAQVIKEFE